jgi:hypothetical protein
MIRQSIATVVFQIKIKVNTLSQKIFSQILVIFPVLVPGTSDLSLITRNCDPSSGLGESTPTLTFPLGGAAGAQFP